MPLFTRLRQPRAYLALPVTLTLVFVATFAFAQEPVPMPDAGKVASDFTLGYYVAGIAGAIHLVMWLLKFSSFLEAKIPARARPLVAFFLGQAGAVFDMLVSGTPRSKAIVTGVIATCIAIATQETLWNGIFGGWEPARAIRSWFSKGGGGGGPAAGAAALLLVFARVFLGLVAVLMVCIGLARAVSGCTPQEREDAKTAIDQGLDDAPIVCAATLEAEQLLNLDPAATKKICNVVDTTEPTVKTLFDKVYGAKLAAARKAALAGPKCK